jgi:Na+/melibiose symporter-like transporter
MLVTYEEGDQVVTITGWRKWLIVAAVMAVLAVILTAIVAIVLGIALTLGFVLLIATPLVLAVALIAWTVRPIWRRPDLNTPDA